MQRKKKSQQTPTDACEFCLSEQCWSLADKLLDSVNKMKRMIPVKNLSCIWRAVFVEIMVCVNLFIP